MTSLPDQTPTRVATVTMPDGAPYVSGFWQIGTAAMRDADLAAVLALAFHRGLAPTPPRKNLPIQF